MGFLRPDLGIGCGSIDPILPLTFRLAAVYDCTIEELYDPRPKAHRRTNPRRMKAPESLNQAPPRGHGQKHGLITDLAHREICNGQQSFDQKFDQGDANAVAMHSASSATALATVRTAKNSSHRARTCRQPSGGASGDHPAIV